MKITKEQFEDFRQDKGRYLRIKNAERFYQNLEDQIEVLGDSVLLDDYILGLRKGREVARRVVVAFYEYLEDCRPFKKPESVLYDKHFYDYPFERQLEIAKFLHTEHTTSEIQEHFDIDARTVRSDLQELEEGITVMGATIQIQKEKKGRRFFYRTTLHPVFLPLNLTEVYALTVYLGRAINKQDPNAQIIHNISDRIKSQLSPYALGRLFPEEDTGPVKNNYVDDEDLARQRSGIIMYLMKSGQPCRFIWEDQEYTGVICWDGPEKGYYIQTLDGRKLEADLKEVDFIIESLDYR